MSSLLGKVAFWNCHSLLAQHSICRAVHMECYGMHRRCRRIGIQSYYLKNKYYDSVRKVGRIQDSSHLGYPNL